MTAADFEVTYALRSGVSVRGLHYQGRYAEPCDCGDEICEGWAMGRQHQDALDEDAWRSRVTGDCGMDVVDVPAHHGVEWPPTIPGDRCER